jgi:hypothetical protein
MKLRQEDEKTFTLPIPSRLIFYWFFFSRALLGGTKN